MKSESLESLPQSDPFDEPVGGAAIEALGKKEPNARLSQDLLNEAKEESSTSEFAYDVSIKDAYLVFRAFCKLTMKPVTAADS